MTDINDEASQRARLNALYYDLFEVDRRGQVVMEDLWRRFVAPARVHTDGGIDAVLKTYEAAAKREVMDYIVRCINRHRNGDDSPPAQESDDAST